MNGLVAILNAKKGVTLRGAHVMMDWRDRHLLGEVISQEPDPKGPPHLIVRFFNGEPWPIAPAADKVEVLERQYEEPK